MFALILILLATGVLTWLVAVGLTAWVLLRPTRLTPARAMARLGRMSPGDLGLAFEEIAFDVPDRNRRVIRLVGWWLPAPVSDRTVVLIHGYGDSRIGALTWAEPIVRRVGCNVLAIDLRAHGESGGSFTTAGLRERFDLERVVNELRAARPRETRAIYLMGLSMGAAVALAAAEQLGDAVDGVIVDSPVVDFYHGAATQLWLMGLAGRSVLIPGLWLTELLLGERFASIRPEGLIAHRLACPVLALAPGDDPFLPPVDHERLRAAVDGRANTDGVSSWVEFPDAPHLGAMAQDPATYVGALQRFCAAGKSDGLARAVSERA